MHVFHWGGFRIAVLLSMKYYLFGPKFKILMGSRLSFETA